MFYRNKTRCCIFVLLSVCGPYGVAGELPPEFQSSSDQNKPVALTLPLKGVWNAGNVIMLPTGDSETSTTLRVPLIKTDKGDGVVLRFRARLDPEDGGWNNLLQIQVNGKILNGAMSNGVRRILNYENDVISTLHPQWSSATLIRPFLQKGIGFLVFFSNSWETPPQGQIEAKREMYYVAVDITDVFKPNAPNKIAFTHLGTISTYKKGSAILIDDLQVGGLPAALYDKVLEVRDPVRKLGYFKPSSQLTSEKITLEADASGAVRLTRGSKAYTLCSEFSRPGNPIQHNYLSCGKDLPKVKTKLNLDKSMTLEITCPPYSLSRTLRPDGDIMRVTDTYCNRSQKVVGIMTSNELICRDAGDVFYTSGRKGVNTVEELQANPTLYVGYQDGQGVGIAVKDTVFRQQMKTNAGPNCIRFLNEHFGLDKGKTYEFKWEVVFSSDGYFGMINAVRNDWGVNHTIPGMIFLWSDPILGKWGAEDYRNVFKQAPSDIVALPWFCYYTRPELYTPWERFAKYLDKITAPMKVADSHITFLGSLEANGLLYKPYSFFKDTLEVYPPNTRRNYTDITSEATTKVIDGTEWKDSVFRDRSGRVILDRHYSNFYSELGANLRLVPVVGNHWYKEYLRMQAFLLEDCGMGGVYVDCFTTFQKDKMYDHWDGHSVEIDPATGVVKSRYAGLGILTSQARANWAKDCFDRKKIMYVNGHPDTAELQALPIMSFNESEWLFDPDSDSALNSRDAADGQLSTPMALGTRPRIYRKTSKKTPEQIIQLCVISYLRHGILYCHYYPILLENGGYGMLTSLYPFTPKELGEGFVIGEDKIAGCVSRTFEWPHAEKPVCKRFNLDGLEIPGGFEVVQKQDGTWRIKISVADWKETYLIRKP